ncbi:MAG: AraC family transcriptional activator of tynA and feaB [Gammaproteobacteria bacterium]|jgi:AraC family transcriptional activator of tynA and feaB
MPTLFGINKIPPAQLCDKWQCVLSNGHYPVAVSELSTATLDGLIKKAVHGDMQISSLRSGRHKLTRHHNQINGDSKDSIIFVIPTKNFCEVKFENGQSTIGCGSAVILRSTLPYSMLCLDDFSSISFQIPCGNITSRVSKFDDICGLPIKLNKHTRTFLIDTLRSLLDVDTADTSNEILTQIVTGYVVDLCASVIENWYCSGAIQNGSEHQQRLRKQIYTYIFSHLEDPHLCPSSIAKNNNLSISYLHKLFKPQGHSVNRWILLKRLERCHEKIISPIYKHLSISRIAFDCGFNSLAHFSTRFREYYGKSPRNLRQVNASLDY